jgi:hypothetical protein
VRIDELVPVARRAQLDRLANILDLAADEARKLCSTISPAHQKNLDVASLADSMQLR